MSVQLITNALLILVLVGWIGYRQLTWRPVAVGRMWRLPIILGVIGLVTLSQTAGTSLTATDVAVLAVELVISLGIGSAMGALATFRPMSEAATAAYRANDNRRSQGPAPQFESRTGWFGLALWVVFIGVRIGIDVWASQAGSTLAASTGVILVMVAANRIARTAVFAARVSKLDAVAA